MARTSYQYETSPRKLQPNKKKNQRPNLKVVKDLPRQEKKVSKQERKKQAKLTLLVATIFVILLAISYQNSKINESFTQMQSLKKELSSLQKENEQLKVGIENSLNLSYIEQQAKEKLGMQKMTNKQTVYVNLPKEDYIESASEKIIIEEEKNWFEKIIDQIFNK